MRLSVVAACFSCVDSLRFRAAGAVAPPQVVAQTPPMGWNSWNYFAAKVDDKGMRAAADELVATGMKDAGYIYVNIDDTWEGERDASGVLHTNSKFPDMKALADYVHSKGLKIGIYSGPGPKTCAGYAASLGHEEQDAKMYADVGHRLSEVRPVQLHPRRDAEAGAATTRPRRCADACGLREDGQGARGDGTADRLLALPVRLGCGVGVGAGAGREPVAHDGRYQPHWDRIYAILEQQAGLEKYAGPGHWNDPDMLEVGNGKLIAG